MVCNSAPFTNLASIQFNTWIKEPNFLNQQKNLEFFDSTDEFLVPKHDMCIRQGFTPMLYCVQGRKCHDILAIYRRRNIMYRRVSTRYFMEKYWSSDILRFIARNRRVSTRYFMEKYWSSDILRFIARNRRFLAIYRWFGDKSAIFLNISHGQRGSTKIIRATVPPSTRYSALPFACCREDLNPKPKGLGFTRLPPRLTCPLIHNMQQMYIYLNSLYKENIRIF